jgi:hypothetical protein
MRLDLSQRERLNCALPEGFHFMPSQIVPVIMCGGAGTRLWPVSRESMPKQFVPLIGQETTFQQVLARVTDRELFARPIVITSADFRFVVAEQLRESGIEADIVLEPMGIAFGRQPSRSRRGNNISGVIPAERPGLCPGSESRNPVTRSAFVHFARS